MLQVIQLSYCLLLSLVFYEVILAQLPNSPLVLAPISLQVMTQSSNQFVDAIYEKLSKAYEKRRRRMKNKKRLRNINGLRAMKFQMFDTTETLEWHLYMENYGRVGHYHL